MARFRLCIATAFAILALIASLLHGQVSDEDTPNSTPRPKHRASATATPKSSPKKKKSPTPAPKKSSSKSKADDNEDEPPRSKPKKSPAEPTKSKSSEEEDEGGKRRATPAAKKSKSTSANSKSKKKKTTGSSAKSRKKKSSGKKKVKKDPEPDKTPKPTPAKAAAKDEASPTPARAIAVPKPAEHPTPVSPPGPPLDTSAQLTIEKSGFEESQGLQPPPSPPPKRFWLWPFSRSRSERRYNYLTRSVIEQIRRAPVASNRWKFIVVHNSGTRQGNARVFDYYHKRVRKMRNGLAYHFVIGNGTSTGNGEVEVGDRWRRQINGGHVHSDFLNNIALGICLVGDFNRDQPTRAQLDSCEELVRYLRERCGKADGRAIPVRPHREVNPPRWATDCPGDAFPYSWFRKF
ncbi:MAG TPA: N-acetylmuramoyl-L-alanine amidase [Chthoniobacterales bacterium]|nr:N-acetylmuramoyl-L-alanine amidase [Chthoniobacterales bacterium]